MAEKLTSIKITKSAELLLKDTVDCANHAIVKRYPSVGADQGRFLTADRFITSVYETNLALEQQARPIDKRFLYRVLEGAGISEDLLRDRWYRVSQGQPYYWNPTAERPVFYTNGDPLSQLRQMDEVNRAVRLLIFGYNVININFNIYSFSGKRTEFSSALPWMEEFCWDIDRQYFDYLEAQSGDTLDKGKFAQARECVHDALYFQKSHIKPRVSSAGAIAFLMLEDQTEETAEYTIGHNLELDTVAYLAEDVRKIFFELLKDKGILPRALPYARAQVVTGNREALLKRINNVKRLYRLMGLNSENDVLIEYKAGNLAELYLKRVINPIVAPGEFSPYNYGDLPISGEIALQRYLDSVLV